MCVLTHAYYLKTKHNTFYAELSPRVKLPSLQITKRDLPNLSFRCPQIIHNIPVYDVDK